MFTVKKLILVLLALVMSCSAAFAESTEFTEKPYADYPTLFSIEYNEENNIAFIEVDADISEYAFTHKYESEYHYSSIYNDILVINYSSTDRFPVLRTWINYTADKPQHFTSVTFILEGKSYTFTDISSEDRNRELENGYLEQLLIKYGMNNVDFFREVVSTSVAYLTSDDDTKQLPVMKMILHGDEDIEAVVPDMFWTDMGMLTLPFFNNDGAWLSYIFDNDGTPCTVSE